MGGGKGCYFDEVLKNRLEILIGTVVERIDRLGALDRSRCS